jgi:5S rRNA maturation endonuclease (ribonuclease M5)
MVDRFKSTYWGTLPHFKIPRSIAQDDTMIFSASATVVLTILHRAAQGGLRWRKKSLVEIKIKNATLQELSGISKDVVSKAVKELQDAGFVKRCPERLSHGEFGANLYQICDPENGEQLDSNGNINYLYANQLRYFTMPSCVIGEVDKPWSLAKLEKAEKHLYIAICWLANIKRGPDFLTTSDYLSKLSRIKTKSTLRGALTSLLKVGLVSVYTKPGSTEIRVLLNDPYTRQPVLSADGTLPPSGVDNPVNYKIGTSNHRVNLNTGNPEDLVRFIQKSMPSGAPMIRQTNGNIMICCPFHDDSTPSCSVDPQRCGFHCFGCQKSGKVIDLLSKLRGETVGETISQMASANGQEATYRQPVSRAEMTHPYVDKNGNVVKEVLRYPGGRFSQRRMTKHGWDYSLDGMKSVLYQAIRLPFAGTAVICEGEKDCDNLMTLQLWGTDGCELVSTTTGGSETWLDELADELLDKRIIIMPDDDEAGARYANAIVASLESRGIKYRVVRFTDTGAKDVSDFLADGHSKEELVERMGSDWVAVSAPSAVERPQAYEPA